LLILSVVLTKTKLILYVDVEDIFRKKVTAIGNVHMSSALRSTWARQPM